MTLADAIVSAQQGRRNYAKRQMTWFRHEPEVHWLNGFGDEPGASKEAVWLIARSVSLA
jgi:tRNA dimethylallyltransferase